MPDFHRMPRPPSYIEPFLPLFLPGLERDDVDVDLVQPHRMLFANLKAALHAQAKLEIKFTDHYVRVAPPEQENVSSTPLCPANAAKNPGVLSGIGAKVLSSPTGGQMRVWLSRPDGFDWKTYDKRAKSLSKHHLGSQDGKIGTCMELQFDPKARWMRRCERAGAGFARFLNNGGARSSPSVCTLTQRERERAIAAGEASWELTKVVVEVRAEEILFSLMDTLLPLFCVADHVGKHQSCRDRVAETPLKTLGDLFYILEDRYFRYPLYSACGKRIESAQIGENFLFKDGMVVQFRMPKLDGAYIKDDRGAGGVAGDAVRAVDAAGGHGQPRGQKDEGEDESASVVSSDEDETLPSRRAAGGRPGAGLTHFQLFPLGKSRPRIIGFSPKTVPTIASTNAFPVTHKTRSLQEQSEAALAEHQKHNFQDKQKWEKLRHTENLRELHFRQNPDTYLQIVPEGLWLAMDIAAQRKAVLLLLTAVKLELHKISHYTKSKGEVWHTMHLLQTGFRAFLLHPGTKLAPEEVMVLRMREAVVLLDSIR